MRLILKILLAPVMVVLAFLIWLCTLTLHISAVQLRDAHPNTVIINARGVHGATVSVQAASVGGGSVRVQYLNGLEVGFSGERTTLIIQHQDAPGVIATVSRLLADNRMNIATMRVFREEEGGRAVMALELDSMPSGALVEALRTAGAIHSVTLLDRLERRRGHGQIHQKAAGGRRRRGDSRRRAHVAAEK